MAWLLAGFVLGQVAPSCLACVLTEDNMHTNVRSSFVTGPALSKRTSGDLLLVESNLPPMAEAAFQYAMDTWASILGVSVPVRVQARWTPIPVPGVLASGRPVGKITHANLPYPDVQYPSALANQELGFNANAANEAEIEVTFNADRDNWYFGTDGNCPLGEFDFVTVAMHELAHGLGFLGSMFVSGELGGWGGSISVPSALPYIYDRFSETGPGAILLSLENPSSTLALSLTAGDVFFDGPAVRLSYGDRVELFSPDPWLIGTSFHHFLGTQFDEASGDRLMRPGVSAAEVHHQPGPAIRGVMRDLGWTLVAPVPVRAPQFVPTITLEVTPNPMGAQAYLQVSGTVSVSGLRILDVAGRRVREWGAAQLNNGGVRWDRTDSRGQRVAAGVYMIEVTDRQQRVWRRVTVR